MECPRLSFGSRRSGTVRKVSDVAHLMSKDLFRIYVVLGSQIKAGKDEGQSDYVRDICETFSESVK